MGALPKTSEGNFLFHTMRRFFECDLEIIAQVRTTAGTAAVAISTTTTEKLIENAATTTAAALTKDLSENIKGIMETATTTAEPASATGTGTGLLKSRMTVTVVSRTFLRILQHLVRLGYLLEHFLGLLVAGVFVRMKLDRFLAVSLLQLLFRGTFGHSKQLVVILFLTGGHGLSFLLLGFGWPA
jgi:hypothetical protein